MQTVLLSSPHFSSWIFRQTPGNDGIWGDYRFVLEDPNDEADWLIAYDRHQGPLETSIPVERRILIVTEPPEFQFYSRHYLDQFGLIHAPYPIPAAAQRMSSGQPALNWFYGMTIGGGGDQVVSRFWPDLEAPGPAQDQRDMEITAISSTKTQTKTQIRRLRFLKLLKAELGERLRIFGRGFERLDDKAEVIDRSRYHLALENCLLPHGWTEKIADPVLGGAFPLFGGSDQITRYFDPEGLLALDMTKPRQSLRKLLAHLDANPALSPSALEAMEANKRRLMQEHNLFALGVRLVQDRRRALDIGQNGEAEEKKGGAARLDRPQELVWVRPPRWRRMFKVPRGVQSLLWKAEIALFERE